MFDPALFLTVCVLVWSTAGAITWCICMIVLLKRRIAALEAKVKEAK